MDESGNPLVLALNGKPWIVRLVLWQHECSVTSKALHTLVLCQRAPFSTARCEYNRRGEPHMSCDVPIAGRHHCPKACCTTREGGLNWWWKSWSRQTDTVHRYVGQGIRISRATTTWIRTEAARENLRRFRCGGQHNPQTSGLVEEPTCKKFSPASWRTRRDFSRSRWTPVNNDIRHNSTPCYESNPHRKEQSSKWDITEKTHSHHMTRIVTSFFPRPPKLHLTA